MPVDLGGRAAHETNESVLHNVAGPIGVAKEPRGVAGERHPLFRNDSFQETFVCMGLIPTLREIVGHEIHRA